MDDHDRFRNFDARDATRERPMLSEAEINEGLALAEKATAGPWEASGTVNCECVTRENCWHTFDSQADILPPLGEMGPVACASEKEADNAAFIAAARTLLPSALTDLLALRTSLKALAAMLEQVATEGEAFESGSHISKAYRLVAARIRELLSPSVVIQLGR